MAEVEAKAPPQFDYSDYKDETVGDNLMQRIQGLAQDYITAETHIANLTEQLADAKATFRDIVEKKIPNLLDEAELGDSTITTPGGHEVKMGTAIRGGIPKGKEQPAFDWLEENKNGNLIKRTFTIDFGKGDEKWAEKFERDCAKRKKPLNLKRKKGVNPQTLLAFIRERLDKGEVVPMDIFGVYRQRFAKVKVK